MCSRASIPLSISLAFTYFQVTSLNVFSFFHEDIVTYRLVLEIYMISETSRYNNEGNALYILRIISRSEYTRDGLDTSP